MKVGIYPIGGIGNQMWIWATGRAFALRNNAQLYIDQTYYDISDRPYPYPYMLDKFVIDAPIGEIQGRRIKEAHYHFDSQIMGSVNEDVWLDGYFQSEKYFADYRDVIIGDFVLNWRLSYVAQAYERLIREFRSPIALHIRRGERANETKARTTHGLMGMEYYHNAEEIVRQKRPEAVIIAFSDDPTWVTNNTPYKDVVVGTTPWEDIYLMSLCRGAIIANSSFSWWGAWLQNQNRENIVVAPENWVYNLDADDKDVVPNRWIKIQTTYT